MKQNTLKYIYIYKYIKSGQGIIHNINIKNETKKRELCKKYDKWLHKMAFLSISTKIVDKEIETT